MTTLNQVHSITATATPGVLIIMCNITMDGEGTFDAIHVYNPSDPFGELTPILTQWMADNPDFPIQPYVPPTIEELRAGAPALPRFDFRTRAKAAGLTTAKVTAYLAGIEDPDKQDDMQMFWDDAQYFARLDPFVVESSAFAGVSPEQMDGVFYIASN